MPQSSLTSWLSKPATVTAPPPAVLRPDSHEPQRKAATVNGQTTEDQATNAQERVPITSKPSTGSFMKNSHPPLPPNVELRGPTKEDIPSFKKINALLLPIPYPESFYREILTEEVDRNITLLALWHDDPSTIGREKGRLVGAARCRLFSQPPSSTTAVKAGARPMLYLSTLVLLSPYRGYGIAAHMVDILLMRAVDDYGIGSVGAHVWEANDVGLEWYRKRGFREVAREQGYYRKLNPTGAVVMQRDVGVMDFAGR